MPFVEAAGVQVNFPFEPYPCQVDYMEKVITCYKDGKNGILESPTGTGKTLSLLCSSLAWVEDKKAQILSRRHMIGAGEQVNKVVDVGKEQLAQQLDKAAGVWNNESAAPKIIYASRTHSQLSQVVQEFRRTAYAHFKICVLGSREQLCIHPTVSKEQSNSTKIHLCRAKVAARDCFFHNNVEAMKPHFQNQVMDIEDLVRAGEKHKCCPYYMAREMKSEAEVIFMPYNYLLDPKSRRAHGVDLQGTIVIFDEAHNLEKICEDSSSFDLSSGDLAAAIRDIDEISRKLQNIESEAQGFDMSQNDGTVQDFTLEQVLRLKAQILHLEEEIDKVPLPKPNEGITKPGNFIFEILEAANLSFESKDMIVGLMDKMTAYLANTNLSSAFSSKGGGISKFAELLKIVFSRMPDEEEKSNMPFHKNAVSKHYKVHLCEEVKHKWNMKKKADGWGAASAAPAEQKTSRVLSYWCFSPGHAMEDLKSHGVRSIILTSGTLSPMSSFKAEMGIEFAVELENPHVIEKHQVFIGVIGKGPDGVMLSSAYSNRFKDEYLASLGNAVVNFSRVVPDGLLIFFPSYPVMEKCMSFWQASNIWNRVEQYKPIFMEPRFKAEHQTAMQNFYDKIDDTTANGAIFSAVCRGKVSEGLDFSDNKGRAVVITGLPFPPRMEPKVMLKMQFLEDMRKLGGKGLTGEQWYRQQASRAVNQAVGRIIRHKQDYGAIILCDHRFSQSESIAQLPSWIRPHVNKYSNFGLAVKDMMTFFKTAQQNLPPPKAKLKGQVKAPHCQGAYFQPTLVRQVVPKHGNIEKSSSVATHVASLTVVDGISSGDGIAKLKIQYEEIKSNHSPQIKLSATQHGLMSALQSHDVFTQENAAESESKLAQKARVDAEFRNKQKSKIQLKKVEQGSITKDGLQSAEQYMAEVKATLSSETYKLFRKLLSEYKDKGEYTAMTVSLADLFTDHQQNYHLFRKFYKFVRPHHKQQFDLTCREIIGQGCGFKPEHALPKKRVAPTFETGSADKKRKVETASSSKNTKETEKCSSIDELNLWKVALNNEGNNADSDNKIPIISDTKMLNLSTQNNEPTPSTSNKPRSKDGTGPRLITLKTTSTPLTAKSMSSNLWSASPCVSNTDEGMKKDKENSLQPEVDLSTVDWSQPKPSRDLHLQYTKINSGYTCSHCKKDATIPLKAPCLHVCCLDCWKVCIGKNKQCPECGGRVLRKYLQRLYFQSGPNL